MGLMLRNFTGSSRLIATKLRRGRGFVRFLSHVSVRTGQRDDEPATPFAGEGSNLDVRGARPPCHFSASMRVQIFIAMHKTHLSFKSRDSHIHRASLPVSSADNTTHSPTHALHSSWKNCGLGRGRGVGG